MKNSKLFFKAFTAICCLMLSAAMALTAVGCKSTDAAKTNLVNSKSVAVNATELGEGKTPFTFTVVHKDGTEKKFVIKTDEKYLADALINEELISGEDGLYVTVDGETLDFNKDKMYWALFVNGKMSMVGADQVETEADAEYTFKAYK